MRTLISGFLQQELTSAIQPFYDYVVSEADKMSPEESENFKVQVFNAIHNVSQHQGDKSCQGDNQVKLQLSHTG